jgi:hypothetical protein
MTIMRIAFAAAVLYYIAPHIGSEVIKSARPAFADAKANLNSDALTQTALEYCKKNAHECLKFATKAASVRESITQEKHMTMPINAALRSTLPDAPPLPPVRGNELRGMKQF